MTWEKCARLFVQYVGEAARGANIPQAAAAACGHDRAAGRATLPPMNAPDTLPTAADVARAAERLKGVAVRTPLINAPVLDDRLNARVFLKAEILQRTGSFKFRGAYNKISSIPPEKREGGVVAYSSGNHAQGVAAAAKLCGMRATIVMPADAPAAKRERTRALGAEIVPYDRDTEDRAAIAEGIRARARRHAGAALRRSVDHRRAGHRRPRNHGRPRRARSQAGRRAASAPPAAGLAAGIALAVKDASPDTQIYAVEPEGFDDTLRSFKSGKRETNARMSGSICDALMSDTPGALTFPITQKLIGQGFAVSDAEVGRAVRYAFEELKLVVEPGGAVSLAALLAGKLDVSGKVVAAVLSGGNIDAALFAKLIANWRLIRGR